MTMHRICLLYTSDPFANVAIAQVDNYVNIRSEASEDSEVLGKLYNNSAAVSYTHLDVYKRQFLV